LALSKASKAKNAYLEDAKAAKPELANADEDVAFVVGLSAASPSAGVILGDESASCANS
jgi:hypothetical protein